MYSDITGYAPKWLNDIGNWFENHWVEIVVGVAFIVLGALVTGLTCGVGTTFWAAFGSAMMTSAVQVAASMALSVGGEYLIQWILGE
jgi:predicted anti-sigma-YlaC factor YlaD